MAKDQEKANHSYPTVRRRRSAVAEPMTKATYQLTKSVVEDMRAAVAAGGAPSASVFVEEAVRERLRALQNLELHASYAAAMDDPAFREDLEEVTAAFEATTGDGLAPSRQGKSRS